MLSVRKANEGSKRDKTKCCGPTAVSHGPLFVTNDLHSGKLIFFYKYSQERLSFLSFISVDWIFLLHNHIFRFESVQRLCWLLEALPFYCQIPRKQILESNSIWTPFQHYREKKVSLFHYFVHQCVLAQVSLSSLPGGAKKVTKPGSEVKQYKGCYQSSFSSGSITNS